MALAWFSTLVSSWFSTLVSSLALAVSVEGHPAMSNFRQREAVRVVQLLCWFSLFPRPLGVCRGGLELLSKVLL